MKAGDHIALVGKSSLDWVTVFMATITYGAVIVPIHQDFNPADLQHIVNHSESVMLFCTRSIWDCIDFDQLPRVRAVILTDEHEVVAEKESAGVGKALHQLSAAFDEKYKSGFYRNDIHYYEKQRDDLMVLNYTSGTTGFSKGVMISSLNLVGNIVYAINSGLMYRHPCLRLHVRHVGASGCWLTRHVAGSSAVAQGADEGAGRGET